MARTSYALNTFPITEFRPSGSMEAVSSRGGDHHPGEPEARTWYGPRPQRSESDHCLRGGRRVWCSIRPRLGQFFPDEPARESWRPPGMLAPGVPVASPGSEHASDPLSSRSSALARSPGLRTMKIRHRNRSWVSLQSPRPSPAPDRRRPTSHRRAERPHRHGIPRQGTH